MTRCTLCNGPVTLQLTKKYKGTDQIIRECTYCGYRFIGVLTIQNGVAIAPSGKIIDIGVHPVTPTCLWRKDD